MWCVAFVQGGQASFHQKGCRYPHLVKSQGFAVYLRLRHPEESFEPDSGAVGSAGGCGYQSVAGMLLAPFRVAPQVQEPLRLQLTGAGEAVEVPLRNTKCRSNWPLRTRSFRSARSLKRARRRHSSGKSSGPARSPWPLALRSYIQTSK